MSTLARTTAIVTVGVLLAGCGDDGNDLAAGGGSDGGPAIEVVARDDGTLPAPADPPTAPASGADEHADEPAAMDDHDESETGMHDDAEATMDDHEATMDDHEAAMGDHDDAEDTMGDHDDDTMADHDDESQADEGHGDEGHADEGDGDENVDEPAMADEPADTVAPEPVDEGFVVNVEMVEFGYVADQTVLPMGEDVTFRFVNTGAIPHEAMFGSEHEQEEFAASGDHGDHGDEGHHGEIVAITLDAGGASDLVVRFDEPGEVWIGCHLPGHWDAGMFATFQIA